MKLGLVMGTGTGAGIEIDMDLIREAEDLGFDSVWTSEAWGSDAISSASWVLAQTTKIKVGTGIIQMSARTPAMAAMTAMTLQQLSGDRFILGIGPSGPQVIEGWHGEPYGRPLTRTREYIDIIKIVTGTIAPAGVRVSAEGADGMIPVFMNPNRFDVFEDALNDGFEKAGGGKSLDNFTVTPFCAINLMDDEAAARQPARENLALYIGGMGARDKNFYNDYAKRLGHEGAAVEIQDHFLAGRRAEALASVPDELIDQVALTGPAGKITERLQDWKSAANENKVHSLLARVSSSQELQVLAKAVL